MRFTVAHVGDINQVFRAVERIADVGKVNERPVGSGLVVNKGSYDSLEGYEYVCGRQAVPDRGT